MKLVTKQVEKTITINEKQLPYCCGVVVCGGNGVGGAITSKEFEDGMKAHLAGKGDFRNDFGLSLYTLSSEQRTEATVLRKLGYEVLKTFRNPNSGNLLTLYGKSVSASRR